MFITKNEIFIQIFLQSSSCALKEEVFKSVQEFYQIFLSIIERLDMPWVWNEDAQFGREIIVHIAVVHMLIYKEFST